MPPGLSKLAVPVPHLISQMSEPEKHYQPLLDPPTQYKP